ncbi:MAG TPA: GNAT family N-acetyltransferase [Anaerolineales bacterium]|nr:GNAT family N-acetyltransferase [Anaerolineales bacterium]
MNPPDYLRLQLRLEGKEIIPGNLLRQVEVVPDEDMPLMVIVQLADQHLIHYFDEALPQRADLHEELARGVYAIRFPNVDRLSTLLQGRNIGFEIGHYKTYIFPEMYAAFKDETVKCYSRHAPEVKAFGFDGFAEQVYGIERDGKIVSACVSARENESCGEAWVYTSPEYRYQGFAQRVVGTWAARLLMAGKVPFYSHKIQNFESASLAKRLGLETIFEEIVILYANP